MLWLANIEEGNGNACGLSYSIAKNDPYPLSVLAQTPQLVGSQGIGFDLIVEEKAGGAMIQWVIRSGSLVSVDLLVAPARKRSFINGRYTQEIDRREGKLVLAVYPVAKGAAPSIKGTTIHQFSEISQIQYDDAVTFWFEEFSPDHLHVLCDDCRLAFDAKGNVAGLVFLGEASASIRNRRS